MQVDIPMAPGLGLYLDEVFFENYNINQAKQALLHNAAAPVKPLNDTGNVTVDPAAPEEPLNDTGNVTVDPASPEEPLNDTGNVTVDPAVCADSTQPKDNEAGETGEAVDNEPVSIIPLITQSNVARR